jgi:23S rRNA pseudouridine1911/1915/1917 synthase
MEQPNTVMSRLVALYPTASKTTLRGMVEAKRVLINGVPAKSMKQELGEKEKLEVLDFSETPTRVLTLAHGLKVVHVDGEIVVVEKPEGLLTSTDSKEKRPTAWRILREYYRRQNNKNEIHLIHRLDKDASGLLVFARTWDAYSSLKQQFFEHTITRRYDVLVHGVPAKKKGRLENLLVEDPPEAHSGMVRVTKDLRLGKLAIMDYEVIGSSRDKKIAHVQCTLFTGRKHQIRVQMAAMGHAVVGDRMYGKENVDLGRLGLHASLLVFAHPKGKREVRFESRMPGVFGHVLRGS